MAASRNPESEELRAVLDALGPEDRGLFAEERQERIAQGATQSPLLDQLCSLRVIRSRLDEGYREALAAYQETLDRKTRMRVGWRKHTLRKVSGEYESPLPWVHPFKLAGDELQAVEEELGTAVAAGETAERESGRLPEVLAKHRLALPLPSPFPKPRWGPGTVQVYR